MKFTITPNLTSLRMSSFSGSMRTGTAGKVPSALRASAKTSRTSGQYLSKADVRSAVNDILKDSATTTNWKDSYLDQVKEQAKKDYAAGVYKGDDYQTMQKDAATKYLSSAQTIVQNRFSKESDAAYTEAWNAAKEAASKSESTETTESSSFDKRV